VSYLSALASAIGPALPTIRLSQRNGWHTVDGVGQFVLGRRTLMGGPQTGVVRKACLHTAETGELSALADAICPVGELSEWCDVARETRDASEHGRLVLAASFAAPFVKVLDLRSIVVHLYGQTRSGKTAVLNLASSVWAEPKVHIVTHNASLAGLEPRMAFMSDLPTCLDELQLQKDPGLRESLIYMYSQGTGRTRGRSDGGVRETARWRGACISTGEEPIISENDPGGQASRTLEFRVLSSTPLVDDALAGRLYRLRHWGRAGAAFLGRLLAADADNLREHHERMSRRMRTELPEQSSASISALAAIALADALALEWVFEDDAGDGEAFGEASVYLMVALCGDTGRLESQAERALRRTVEWINANRQHFVRIRESAITDEEVTLSEDRDPCYGVIASEDEVWLYPELWASMVRQHGMDPRAVTANFRESHWIDVECGTDGKPRHPLKRPPEGKRQRMIVLNAKAFEFVGREE
jgi:hypothetical protein